MRARSGGGRFGRGRLGELVGGGGAGRVRVLAAVGGVGVALVVASALFGPTSPPAPLTGDGGSGAAAFGASARTRSARAAPTSPGATATEDPLLAYERRVDAYVASVLDQVAGAGNVAVAVTVARLPTRLYARDTSSSRQGQGAAASVSQQQALALRAGQLPVALGEVAAPVVGAVAVAPGARDPAVRAELTQALETLLGLGANQVIVLPGKGEEP
jgi:stage III sporulation protein AG